MSRFSVFRRSWPRWFGVCLIAGCVTPPADKPQPAPPPETRASVVVPAPPAQPPLLPPARPAPAEPVLLPREPVAPTPAELEARQGWGDSFRRRTVRLKSRVFPPATLALLLVIANFVLGAAAHTRALPAWAHALLAWATLAACALALLREYQALGENNRLISEAGRRRSPETQ